MKVTSQMLDFLGPFGPLIIVGTLGVLMVLMTIPILLKDRQDPLEKLKKASRSGVVEEPEKKKRLRSSSRNEKLDKYASFLEPQDAKAYSQIKLTLLQAGYRHRDAVRFFHFAQMALGIGFLLLGVVYFLLFKSGGDTSTQQMLLYILGPGGAGYMIPKYWVTKRQQQRQEEITDGFPDSLDMMLVCIEAGPSILGIMKLFTMAQ